MGIFRWIKRKCVCYFCLGKIWRHPLMIPSEGENGLWGNVRKCPFVHKLIGSSPSPPTPSSLTLWSAEASHKQLAHVGDWTWVGCEAWGDPSKKDHCQVLFNSHSMASCWKQRINPHMFSFLFHACAGWISWGCRPSRDSTWLLLSRLQPWHGLEIFDLEQEESFLPGHQLHPSWAFLAELLWELSFPLLGSL